MLYEVITVHHLGKFVRGLGQCLGLLLDGFRVIPFHSFFEIVQGILDLLLGGVVKLLTMFLEGFFGGVGETVGLVLGLDQLAFLLVFTGVAFGVLDHALDFFIGQAAGCCNLDRLP